MSALSTLNLGEIAELIGTPPGAMDTDRYSSLPNSLRGHVHYVVTCWTETDPQRVSTTAIVEAYNSLADKSPTERRLPRRKDFTPRKKFTPEELLGREIQTEEMARKVLQQELDQANSRAHSLRSSLDQATTEIHALRTDWENSLAEIARLRERPATVTLNFPSGPTTLPTDRKHKIFPHLLASVGAGLNTLLVGPAGSGKTTIARQVAEALGKPFFFTSAIAQEHKLLGFIDAYGKYHSTAFRDAFDQPAIFLFDEMDASSAAALLSFNTATSNNQQDFPTGIVHRHPECIFIAAANTHGTGADRQYIGRNQLDAATLDRWITLSMDYDEELELALVPGAWTEYVHQYRRAVADLGLRHIVSFRAIEQGSRLLSTGLPPSVVVPAVLHKHLSSIDVGKIHHRIGDFDPGTPEPCTPEPEPEPEPVPPNPPTTIKLGSLTYKYSYTLDSPGLILTVLGRDSKSHLVSGRTIYQNRNSSEAGRTFWALYQQYPVAKFFSSENTKVSFIIPDPPGMPEVSKLLATGSSLQIYPKSGPARGLAWGFDPNKIYSPDHNKAIGEILDYFYLDRHAIHSRPTPDPQP